MRTAALGDIADIVSGATPKTGVAEFWGGDIQWATPADLSKLDGPYISSTPRKITQAGVRSCATTVLPPGSVLLSSRAPIGHVAINTSPMATNQGFKSLVPGPSIDSKYLYHWLKSKTEYLQSLGNGATFKELSKKTAERIQVPVPPLPEQRRIAAILDHTDALRAKRRELLAHAAILEQSVFNRLFGDLRSNDRAWPVRPLSELARNEDSRRVPLKVSDRAKRRGAYAYYGASGPIDSIDEFIYEGTRLLVSEDGANLLARTTPIAFIASGRFWVNNHAHVLAPNGEAALHFLRVAIETLDIRSIITGSTQPKLTRAALDSIPVPTPPTELQQHFEHAIDKINRQRHAFAVAEAAEQELFASVQSRAFRGEL